MPALIWCSCETWDQSCAKTAVWESTYWGLPTFAWGLHWSSDAQLWFLPKLCCSYACAWPRALLVWTVTHRLNFLFWPQTYLVSMDLPCHHGLAWQSLQYWLILVIVTSPTPFLQGVPLLMRLVPLYALLSPLAHLPLRRSPLLLLPVRCIPRCFGNFIISENNGTEYWNPDLSTEINADFVPCITKSLLRHDLL